jgi:protein SCO1/2
MNRVPKPLLALGALALVAVVLAAIALMVSPKSSNGSTGSDIHPSGLQGIIQSPLQPKPNFTLTDTSGQPFNLQQDTAGDVTLLYFGYTHCPDICPTQMADMAIGLSKLSTSVRSHIKVVFVTTDPNRDTPNVIRQWLNNFNPSFIGLTGTTAQIEAAEASMGMPPTTVEPLGNGNYSVDHAAWVTAFTEDNMAHVIYPAGITPSVWSHDLPRLVNQWQ